MRQCRKYPNRKGRKKYIFPEWMRCLFKRLLLASRSCDIPAESSLHHSQDQTDNDRNCKHNQTAYQQFYSRNFFYQEIMPSQKKKIGKKLRWWFRWGWGVELGAMWRPEEHDGKRYEKNMEKWCKVIHRLRYNIMGKIPLKHNIMGKIPQKIHALSTSSLPLL